MWFDLPPGVNFILGPVRLQMNLNFGEKFKIVFTTAQPGHDRLWQSLSFSPGMSGLRKWLPGSVTVVHTLEFERKVTLPRIHKVLAACMCRQDMIFIDDCSFLMSKNRKIF